MAIRQVPNGSEADKGRTAGQSVLISLVSAGHCHTARPAFLVQKSRTSRSGPATYDRLSCGIAGRISSASTMLESRS